MRVVLCVVVLLAGLALAGYGTFQMVSGCGTGKACESADLLRDYQFVIAGVVVIFMGAIGLRFVRR